MDQRVVQVQAISTYVVGNLEIIVIEAPLLLYDVPRRASAGRAPDGDEVRAGHREEGFEVQAVSDWDGGDGVGGESSCQLRYAALEITNLKIHT